MKGFPSAERLHPFERALLDLTFGPDVYQKRLARLTALRQSAVEVRALCVGQRACLGWVSGTHRYLMAEGIGCSAK